MDTMYYALLATNEKHAKSLVAKSRRDFGEGTKRGLWIVVGPTNSEPWSWREALPNDDYNMYSGISPEAALEAAGR